MDSIKYGSHLHHLSQLQQLLHRTFPVTFNGLMIQSSKGHISFNWPFAGYYYRWCLRRIRLEDFVEIRGKPQKIMNGTNNSEKEILI
jgi:hypothetical protein